MLTGCREYRKDLMDLARGTLSGEQRRELLAHAGGCGECARFLDEQLGLSAALDDLKNDLLPEAAKIEARVLAEFDRARAPKISRWVLVAGLAAAMCLGVVLLARRQPVMHPPVRVTTAEAPAPAPAPPTPPERPKSPVQRASHRAAPRPVVEENPFFTIPYTIPLAPDERATVVRMEVPVAALIAVGFDVASAVPGDSVEADVLVSQDGRARAIRPVNSGNAVNSK
jgi:hypothetical protein